MTKRAAKKAGTSAIIATAAATGLLIGDGAAAPAMDDGDLIAEAETLDDGLLIFGEEDAPAVLAEQIDLLAEPLSGTETDEDDLIILAQTVYGGTGNDGILAPRRGGRLIGNDAVVQPAPRDRLTTPRGGTEMQRPGKLQMPKTGRGKEKRRKKIGD